MDLKGALGVAEWNSGQNGLEAAKQIKSFRPELPVIAQTAYSTREDKENAIKNGCDDFVSKPIKKDILFGLLDKHLKKWYSAVATNHFLMVVFSPLIVKNW